MEKRRAHVSGHPLEEEQMEILVGTLLRWGVMIAAVVALIGGVLFLLRFGGTPVDYRTFRGEPALLSTVGGILGGVAALEPRAIVQLGLLLLIATPVARVALSLVAFAKLKDGRYVVITAIVLAVLIWSLTG